MKIYDCVIEDVINLRDTLFRWYKEEESALLSSAVIGSRLEQYDGTLIINQVAHRDAGKWLCVANNSLGEEKAIIKLVVIAPIHSHIEPQRLEVDVGKSATFNCSVRGGAQINLPVVWLKDGRPVMSDPFSIDDRIRLIDNNILHIRAVIREDSGMRFIIDEFLCIFRFCCEFIIIILRTSLQMK